MMSADRQREDQALDWVRRLQDPHFADWVAHAAWLEADPGNLDAFDHATMLIDGGADGLAPAAAPTSAAAINDNIEEAPPVRGRRTRWATGLGLALAAGIVGVVAAPSLLHGGAQPYLERTGVGEQRSIALADGTLVALNGDSVLRLDHADPRTAVLEKGEAFFTVVHDPARPFLVRSSDAAFEDVGTAFDVARDGTRTRIAVREGAVLYDPQGAATRLNGGQAMDIAEGNATVRRIDAGSVGGWRSGRLVYDGAPMTDVAADLSRATGQVVIVDRTASAVRFSGVIMVDADDDRMLHRVATVAGLALRHDGGGWHMVSPAR